MVFEVSVVDLDGSDWKGAQGKLWGTGKFQFLGLEVGFTDGLGFDIFIGLHT
jgi:hypothetical protein